MRPLLSSWWPFGEVSLPVLAVLASLAGCAHIQRDNYVKGRAAEITYAQPLPQLWPEVVGLLRDKGFHAMEDPNSFTLETEWKEQIRGSQLAGAWTKYVAVGRTLANGRTIVRFYFDQKAAAGYEKDGTQHNWGVNPKVGGGASENATLFSELDRNSDVERGALRVGAKNSFAQRDLELEWELLRRVDPAAAKDIVAMAELDIGDRKAAATITLNTATATPLAPAQHLEAATPESDETRVAQGDCGAAIPGFMEHVSPGAVVLLGEQPHGTEEIPRFVGAAACQVALTGLPVQVGLELPFAEQKLVDRYLASDGTPIDQEQLMEGRSWFRPYQDGRSSRAMLELIESLRGLKQKGLPLSVFVYDEPSLAFDERDAWMAKHVMDRAIAQPESVLLVLTGNVHARTRKGTAWDRNFEPMGYKLVERYGQVVPLDAAFADGTSWVCTLTPSIDCGVRRARGRYNGSQTFVHRFTVPSRDGFVGFFYVGPVKASPPALVDGSSGPTSAKRETPKR